MPRLLVVSLLAASLLATSASAQTPRVIGGQDAGPGEYPWTVALVSAGFTAYDTQFCGGTLIKADVVLTAAHCVEGEQAEDIEVLQGATILSDADPGGPFEDRYFAVESIAVHPDAVLTASEVSSDLAILKLATPADPADVLPNIVGLGATGSGPFRVSGWGEMTVPPATPLGADTMQWADVDPVTDTACEDAWEDSFDADSMICALTTSPFADSCNGDSGGPLVAPNAPAPDPLVPADWMLVGAVSFGSTECNDPSLPGVYADLAGPALNGFAVAAASPSELDDPLPQPEHESGAPVLGGSADVGSTLTCDRGTAQFSGGNGTTPVSVTMSIRRVANLVAVGGASYTLTAADAGSQFLCEARATVAGTGGAAISRSPASQAVRPPATVVQVPGPVQTVPGPTVVQTVTVPAPRVNDTSAPRVTKVSRKCTKQRKCTFTVTTSDAKPSAGVTALNATATTIRARTCRKNGRRTVCASVTSRDLTVRRNRNGTFRVTTPKALPRGTHTLVLVAADGNGNVQLRPHRTSFRVR